MWTVFNIALHVAVVIDNLIHSVSISNHNHLYNQFTFLTESN